MKKVLLVCGLFIHLFGYAQKPELVLPLGHSGTIANIGYHKGRNYYFSTGDDGTIKAWEKESGKLLYSAKKGNYFTLSPDSLVFASIAEDKKAVIIKSTRDGGELYQLTENLHSFKSLLFSPDGNFLATFSISPPFTMEVGSKTYSIDSVFVSLWNRITGKLIYKKFSGISWPGSSLTSNPEIMQFSHDNKFLATALEIRKDVKVWEVKTGKLKYSLLSNSYNINNIVFSPDSKVLLISTSDNKCFIWDYKKEKQIASFNRGLTFKLIIEFSMDGKYILTQDVIPTNDTAFIWETKTGRLCYSLPKDEYAFFLKTMFSPDGKSVLYSSRIRPEETVLNNLELATGKIIYSIKHTYQNHITLENLSITLDKILFTPYSNLIITLSFVGTIKVWDKINGQFLYSLGSDKYEGGKKIELSIDGNYLIEISSKKKGKIWDYRTGKMIRELSFEGHSNAFIASDISFDSRYIVTASTDNKLRIWTTNTGQILHNLSGHTGEVKKVKFSPDGQYIISASWDNTVKIWNTITGQLIHSLEHPNIVIDGEFSPDSKHFVTACGDDIARIWDTETGSIEQTLKGHTELLTSVRYSHDGKYVITASNDKSAIGWETDSGKLTYTLSHEGWVTNACYSPDGKIIMTEQMFSMYYFWDSDFSKGKMELMESKGANLASVKFQYSPDGKNEIWWLKDSIWHINIKNGELTKYYFPDGKQGMTFSRDGKHLIVVSNAELKIYDATNYQFEYKLIAIDSSDYLVIDNDGRFDGTEAARKMLYYVCGNEIIDLDQIKDLCWEPGLVEKIMGTNTEPVKAKRLDEISICGNTPIIENIEDDTDQKKFKIKRRGGGIGELAIYINQKEVEKIPVSSLVFTNDEAIVIIDESKYQNYFEPGKENAIQLQARTADLSISTKGALMQVKTNTKPTSAPNLYAIIAGVSDYKGDKLDLRFAAKDAEDFSNALQESARALLNIDGKEHVFITTLLSNKPNSPSKSNISKAFADIKSKAKANDIVVVYLSGHGENFGTESTNFYYLTEDAASFELSGIEKEVAISTNEFAEWLKAIPAGKQVLILDACASGKLAEDMLVAMRAGIPSDQIRALDRLNSRTGTFILSGAAANQSAYETSIYGQGLLTYSLLYGMKSGTALKDNQFVDVDKLFQYSADKVKELAAGIGGIQDPVISKPNGGASFDIGKIDATVASKIVLALPKPIFTNSKFSNRDTDDDNLGLEKALDDLLSELASKGRESELVFTEKSQLPESYKIVGSYQIINNKITITIRVKKGNLEIQKFEIKDFEADKEKLAKAILDGVEIKIK